jgi:hypothetical protein
VKAGLAGSLRVTGSVAIAEQLWRGTTVPLAWVADSPRMATRTHLAHLRAIRGGHIEMAEYYGQTAVRAAEKLRDL